MLHPNTLRENTQSRSNLVGRRQLAGLTPRVPKGPPPIARLLAILTAHSFETSRRSNGVTCSGSG